MKIKSNGKSRLKSLAVGKALQKVCRQFILPLALAFFTPLLLSGAPGGFSLLVSNNQTQCFISVSVTSNSIGNTYAILTNASLASTGWGIWQGALLASNLITPAPPINLSSPALFFKGKLVSPPAVFTNNAIINIGDTTYEGRDIVVSNCTLTVNGAHNFASLQVISNAVLAHSAAPNGEAGNLLSLAISGNLGLDSSSEIDVSGLGYAAGAGPGAGTEYSGWSGSGAGYGGMGGLPGGGGVAGGGYDSVLTPSLWGSGGGASDESAGGARGEAPFALPSRARCNWMALSLRMACRPVILPVAVRAEHPNQCRHVVGGGSISAQGASAISGGGGGGGGRIALYLTTEYICWNHHCRYGGWAIKTAARAPFTPSWQRTLMVWFRQQRHQRRCDRTGQRFLAGGDWGPFSTSPSPAVPSSSPQTRR